MNRQQKVRILSAVLVSIVLLGGQKVSAQENLGNIGNEYNNIEDVLAAGLIIKGAENKEMITGETFFFKRGVEVFYNEQRIDEPITVKNIDGVDISDYESVKMSIPGQYTYYYLVTYNGETIEIPRVINVLDPKDIDVQVIEIEKNKLGVDYQITNPYSENARVYLEDWSLFEPNFKENLGEFSVGEEKKFQYNFEVVPVFNYLKNEGNSFEEPDLNSELYKGILYTESGELSFAPTVYYNDLSSVLLGVSTGAGSIDMSTLVNDVKVNNESRILIEILTEDKEYRVGDTVTIAYNYNNSTNESYSVSVEDWTLFGSSHAEELGQIEPNSTGVFTKKIELTQDMINENNKIESMPALHFYQDEKQVMVIKKDLNYTQVKPVKVVYLDESGNELAKSKMISGSFYEAYDASTEEYKILKIDDYVLDENNLPENAVGIINNEEQLVEYIYKKDPIELGTIVVKFLDENGSKIKEAIKLHGTIGTDYDLKNENIDLAVEGYHLVNEKLPENSKGIFKDEEQQIIYVYEKDQELETSKEKEIVVSSDNDNSYKGENKPLTNGSSSMSKWEVVNGEKRNLPKTGEENNAWFIFIGFALVGICLVSLKYKKS